MGKVRLPVSGLIPSGRMRDLVAVDLSSSSVKVVHATRGPEELVAFRHLNTREFGENADDEISQYLAGCIKEFGVSSRDILCMIPSTLFISKNVDMPSSDREEIDKIIDLQAGRYTPYSRDEIVIDYVCMETTGQHYTNVLLIIVNRQVVDRYLQVAGKAGLNIERFVISSEGMANCYDAMDETGSDSYAVGGIHIEENFSDFTVINNHQMVFVRNIPVGFNHFKKDREHALNDFLGELDKSVVAYRDQGVGKTIKSMIVTGLIDGLAFLEESIRKTINRLYGPGGEVKFVPYATLFQAESDLTQRLESEQKNSFFPLMASLSALLFLKIDLTPKEIKLKRRVRQGSKEVMTLGILIMVCLVLWCLYLATKIYIKSDIIQKLDEIQSSTAEDARLLERASTKTRVVKSLLKDRGKALYVFERVTSLIGKEIYLTDFSYDTAGDILLVGTANSMSRVFAFVSELEESNYFSSVKTKSTKTRRVGQMDVADFEIECTLSGEI
ncbi:MAG: pilus assembly protein PilM [Candidatus Omnitrophica bacterium]|nr:pilus assembly protein PilM [Candidatus Omnitrophota bacterium]